MSLSNEAGETSPWVPDPEVMIFSGGNVGGVGVTEQHRLGERLLSKSTEEVKAQWDQAVEAMRHVITSAETTVGNYELSEVEFKLGFTASGTIVFIAGAGIEATISATFKRKENAAVKPDSAADSGIH